MVTDDIRNLGLYDGLGQSIKKGMDYLRSVDFSLIQDGTYEIDGDNVYVVIRTYETKPQHDCRWEAHKRYIDIQYLVQGEERMGYAFIKDLISDSDYSEDRDIYFMKGDGDFISLKPGRFMILSPEDAHMPEVQKNRSCMVRKIVIKVKENTAKKG